MNIIVNRHNRNCEIIWFQKIPGDGAHGPHGQNATVIACGIGAGPAMIQSLATEEHSVEGKTMMLMFAWADHAQVILSEYKSCYICII